MTTPPERIEPCPACDGQGSWTETHYVTREMASDACAPDMEGMPMKKKVRCHNCGGSGQVEEHGEDDGPGSALARYRSYEP